MDRKTIERLKIIQLEDYGLSGKDLAAAGFIKRYFSEFSPEVVAEKIMTAQANGVKFLMNQIYMEIDQYLLPKEKAQYQVLTTKEWLVRDDLNFEKLEVLLDSILEAIK